MAYGTLGPCQPARASDLDEPSIWRALGPFFSLTGWEVFDTLSPGSQRDHSVPFPNVTFEPNPKHAHPHQLSCSSTTYSLPRRFSWPNR